jgi:hypothetical protein
MNDDPRLIELAEKLLTVPDGEPVATGEAALTSYNTTYAGPVAVALLELCDSMAALSEENAELQRRVAALENGPGANFVAPGLTPDDVLKLSNAFRGS